MGRRHADHAWMALVQQSLNPLDFCSRSWTAAVSVQINTDHVIQSEYHERRICCKLPFREAA
jgi:hypothetical protein